VNGSVVLENRGGDRGGRGGSSQRRFGECSHDMFSGGKGGLVATKNRGQSRQVLFPLTLPAVPRPVVLFIISYEPETFDTT
jgi:hypothetical protein